MRTIEAARYITSLQAEVLERVKQTREAALLAFADDEDEQCPICSAPLYEDEPCCEGAGE